MKFNLTNKRTIGLLVVAAFGVLSLWGAHLSVMRDSKGMMLNCPFAGKLIQACPMSVTSHVSHWQQLFLSIPAKNGTLVILSVLLLAGAFFIIKYLTGFANFALVFRPGGGVVAARSRSPNSFNNLFRTAGSGIVHKRE